MNKDRRRGFTLVEVILSIAVLAVVSGFILQFFISSDQLNKQSSHVDNATVLAVSVLEEYKAQNTPIIAAQAGSRLEGAEITDFGDKAVLYLNAQMTPASGKDDRAYALTAVRTQLGDSKALDVPYEGSLQEKSGLFRIDVKVEALGTEEETIGGKVLVELFAQRYFVWMEGTR